MEIPAHETRLFVQTANYTICSDYVIAFVQVNRRNGRNPKATLNKVCEMKSDTRGTSNKVINFLGNDKRKVLIKSTLSSLRGSMKKGRKRAEATRWNFYDELM
jgi:hypothetical protein